MKLHARGTIARAFSFSEEEKKRKGKDLIHRSQRDADGRRESQRGSGKTKKLRLPGMMTAMESDRRARWRNHGS